jgi:hypothetical protein
MPYEGRGAAAGRSVRIGGHVNDGAQRKPNMTLRLRSIASMMSLGCLITLTSAQQPPDTRQQSRKVDIFSYGDLDRTCMRWTDGCRNCSRGSGSLPDCGNIGIACQPQDKVTCFGRLPESSKPDGPKQ